ncbi:MAG TPA: helix-hairpin-helix domain-containing protein [Acidobacteriota bacterium]|nr:helix-hairpin-helix domain-containing protein [Acidobacteriota bacterium]HQF86113.1 helix-hairpin-helix domain-containing protein [Acidobacteriota bacterium]HQG90644.1 helix-hairpin-helix domain-containing protein [Acidobacteriota bacterium]HQK87508.1 helix-hairpin-helix domain-containing protein [Acidobacteriota bacterium]
MTVNRRWIVGLMLAVLIALPPVILAEGSGNDTSKGPADTVRKININTATAAELEELPGIGPKTAQRIVEWRKENGKFQRVEDLMAVKGIGEKKMAQLKPLVTVQ